jgi:shikimate dehydrogenase
VCESCSGESCSGESRGGESRCGEPSGERRRLVSGLGTHRLVGVMGSPIAHSLSPILHRAAFESLGLSWQSQAFDIDESTIDGALASMAPLAIAGLSVTMPLKQLVARRVDVLSDVARDLDAVNCITLLADGRLEGHNTDGAGFVDALHAALPGALHGRRVAVLGAGGAARAVIRAVAQAGASDVVVINRTESSAVIAAQLAGGVGRVGWAVDVSQADVVVQATSAGMAGAGSDAADLACDPALLHGGQIVAELIYHPATTPFMTAAGAAGARVVGGLGMLVHQAVHAVERWTGLRPDPVFMELAGRRELLTR